MDRTKAATVAARKLGVPRKLAHSISKKIMEEIRLELFQTGRCEVGGLGVFWLAFLGQRHSIRFVASDTLRREQSAWQAQRNREARFNVEVSRAAM